MTYIILAAGKVQVSASYIEDSKILYKLDRHSTVLQRMVRTIRNMITRRR